jgi:predicted AAA+ superfamily ATPase
MDIKDYDALLHNPRLGASWEGFALEEIIRHVEAEPGDCYFWSVHNQVELDLLIFKKGKRLGFEFKYSDAPRCTRSLQIALEVLSLDELIVIYPGEKDYQLTEKVWVRGIQNYLTQV